MAKRIGLTLFLVFVAASADASEVAPHISPASGSDVILSVRSDTEPELRLQYRVEHGSGSPETITLGLAKDYHYKNSAGGLWINDYRLHRIFRVQPNSGLINDSLYADAWFRGAELENRAMITAMLKKAGVDAGKAMAAQDPYWAETELGVTSAKFPRPNLRRSESHGRISWSLGDDEVAAVRFREDSVPEEVRGGLRRWWPSWAAIHPQIADELTQTGRVPAELWVRQRDHGAKSFETAHWSLMQAEWIEGARYPLPPGLAPVPTEARGDFPEIYKVLSTDVAEQRRPPVDETYRARVESAITHTAGLEAYLWLLEMQLASGVTQPCAAPSTTDFCALAARVGPLAKMDSRMAIANAPRSPDAADRPQFDTLPNAYVLRLLWATRPTGKDVKYEDSEHDLLIALKAAPIANFCKDTGDFYAGSWRPFAAWQVWDLGRLMAGHRRGDLLDGVDRIEEDVVRRQPALF